MELIRIVNDIKQGFLQSGIIREENIFILKDIDKDINKFRNHNQDYSAFISVTNAGFSVENQDSIDIAAGVAGVSSVDDNDYIQVVSKCLYSLKESLKYSSYISDDDINEMSVIISSEEREDSILTYVYGDMSFEIKYANGSD